MALNVRQFQRIVDFGKRSYPPLNIDIDRVIDTRFNTLEGRQIKLHTGVSRHYVEFNDNIVPFTPTTFNSEFGQIEQNVITARHKPSDNIYEHEIYLTPKRYYHSRQAYNLFNVLSDLGGVIKVVTTFVAMAILPYSQHSFNI